MKTRKKTRAQAAPEKRTYQSDLREKQREQTRNAILDAFCAMMTEKGPEACTIPEIAKRAGVALRTVYHHFPAREDLIAALNVAVRERLGNLGYPSAPEDIPDITLKLFVQFDRNPDLIRAQLLTGLGREMRDKPRMDRVKAIRDSLRPLTDALPEAEALGAAGVIKHLFSAEAWWAMKRDFGLDGEAAGKAAAWAIDVLLADLRKRARAAIKHPAKEKT